MNPNPNPNPNPNTNTNPNLLSIVVFHQTDELREQRDNLHDRVRVSVRVWVWVRLRVRVRVSVRVWVMNMETLHDKDQWKAGCIFGVGLWVEIG